MSEHQRSRSEITAEGFREVDNRLTGIETLLTDIRQILVDLADAHSEHRHATRDGIDRLGTRVYALEHSRGSNGGE